MWKVITDEWVNSFGDWDMPMTKVKDGCGNEYEAKHAWIEEDYDGYQVAWQDDSYGYVAEPVWYWEQAT